jgi:hypothetical protein
MKNSADALANDVKIFTFTGARLVAQHICTVGTTRQGCIIMDVEHVLGERSLYDLVCAGSPGGETSLVEVLVFPGRNDALS